jgi:hypothetical protein
VSPSNILLDADSNASLMDFGLARLEDQAAQSTRIMGTVGYTAPERYEGRPADARSDLYGLGAVAWLAATGEAPFAADNPMATLRLQTEGAQRLADKCPQLGHTAAVIDALLSPRPDRRPDGADSLLHALSAGPEALAATRVARVARVAQAGPLQRGLGWSTVAAIALGFLQDCGGFALGGIIDGQSIPEPDTFAVAMGVSIFLGLPLVTVPTIVAGLRTPAGDPSTAPVRSWAGLGALMALALCYGLFAGVVGPNLGGPEPTRILILVAGHMAALIPLAATVLVLTRFFGLGWSVAATTARPGLVNRATKQLDQLEDELKDAPAPVRADIRARVRDLRQRVAEQASALATADREIARLAPDEAEIDRLSQRLERLRALGQQGDPDVQRLLDARLAASDQAEALQRARVRATARLVEIAAAAARARAALRGSDAVQTVGDLLAELEDRAHAAARAEREVL